MLETKNRFKKVIIPVLTILILISLLIGCASAKAGVQVTDTPEAKSEAYDLKSTQANEDIGQDQEVILQESNEAIGQNHQATIATETAVKVEPYEQEELEGLFEKAYQNVHSDSSKLKIALLSPAILMVEGVDEQYILIELDELCNISDNSKLPKDYNIQYRDWREIYLAAMLAKAEYAESLFEEVNEEVWTLNETTPYSTFDEDNLEIKDEGEAVKKGTQLNRTGKGTKEVAEWSRCVDADGNIVYIVSIDLTTTKPVVHTGGGNSGGNANTTPPQQQPAQQQTPPPAQQQPSTPGVELDIFGNPVTEFTGGYNVGTEGQSTNFSDIADAFS